MKDLVEALTILLKYGDLQRPTFCEHDLLCVHGIDPNVVSLADKRRLQELGFGVARMFDLELFVSYRFGSA